jgi:regulator of replication initiation timing
MTIQSPINEMFGCELDYIQRGLSQLDLILNAKDRRIADLDMQLANANKENVRLQDEISKLRKIVFQYENSEKASSASNLEQEVIDKFFESL